MTTKTTHKPTPVQAPKRGEIWQPIDPAHHDVIVSQASDTRVFLQYVKSLEVSFVMDLAVFIKYYRFSHRARGVRFEQFEPTQRFFA